MRDQGERVRDEGVEMRDKGGGVRDERGVVREQRCGVQVRDGREEVVEVSQGLIWIRQNDADPLDPEPLHCFGHSKYFTLSNYQNIQ